MLVGYKTPKYSAFCVAIEFQCPTFNLDSRIELSVRLWGASGNFIEIWINIFFFGFPELLITSILQYVVALLEGYLLSSDKIRF